MWEIGDGTDIQIWKNNWIPSTNGPPPSNFQSSGMCLVSQLIDHETNLWNLDTLRALFDEVVVKEIIRIRIPLTGKDRIRWKPANNGFSLLLNDNLVYKPTKNNLFVGWKSFRRHKLPPRVHHFIWKFLHKCLATKSKLASITRHQDDCCSPCGNYPETIQQLFFDCTVFKCIWTHVIPSLTAIIQNQDLYQWLCNFFLVTNNNMHKDYRMYDMACFTLWMIWKSRCSKIFENKSLNLVDISNSVLLQLEEWIRSRVNLSTQNHPTSRTTHSWLPPGNGILKINFDASHIDKNTLSGWGLICRNDAGITYGLRGGTSGE